MGIDAFILVNITDYFFGLCNRLWGRPFIPGSKGSFSRHQDASLLSLEFRFKVVVFACFSVRKTSDGTWIARFFPLGLEWPTVLPTWEKFPLVASRLPSGDPAAHLSPWCPLSLHPCQPIHFSCCCRTHVCARWALWAFTSRVYFLILLTGLLPEHHCLNGHAFWTPFQIVKGMFSTEQTKRTKTASAPFALFSLPIPAGRTGKNASSRP